MATTESTWQEQAVALHRTIRWHRVEAGHYTAEHNGVHMSVERVGSKWTFSAAIGAIDIYPEEPCDTAWEAKVMVAWNVHNA